MKDQFRIDSHKMIYHPKYVANLLDSQNDWNLLKKIYPIYVEVSPVGFCNHRCVFCSFDYMGYKNQRIDTSVLKRTILNMSQNGVKSIMFAGEGEPSLYKDLPDILEYCVGLGIDVSMTTNAVPFNETNSKTFVKNCKWIKVSLNGGDAYTYKKMHRSLDTDFDTVIKNIKNCVTIKRENKYKCTLGVQILLTDDNASSVTNLAEICQSIGVDYLVVKPYSQHFSSQTVIYKNIDYSKYLYLKYDLSKYNNDNFNVIFRDIAFSKTKSLGRYEKCLSTPFLWSYISSDGSVCGCSSFLTEDRFNLGNINEESFSQIWEGEKRKQCIEYVKNSLCTKDCRINCRMDEINNYLWQLTHPNEHINFI